jgi:hypothetical protein
MGAIAAASARCGPHGRRGTPPPRSSVSPAARDRIAGTVLPHACDARREQSRPRLPLGEKCPASVRIRTRGRGHRGLAAAAAPVRVAQAPRTNAGGNPNPRRGPIPRSLLMPSEEDGFSLPLPPGLANPKVRVWTLCPWRRSRTGSVKVPKALTVRDRKGSTASGRDGTTTGPRGPLKKVRAVAQGGPARRRFS